jgi:hypothetical protein
VTVCPNPAAAMSAHAYRASDTPGRLSVV